MMHTNQRRLLWRMMVFSGLIGWAACVAQAQEALPVRITMHDGSSVVGTILAETDDALEFRTAAGVEMTIPKAQIARRETLRGRVVSGKILRSDPNNTRLLFAPTARSQTSGGYVALYEIFFPYVSVGIGNLSVGGGITLFPAEDQLVYGAAKLTLLERQNMALAAGAFVLTVTGGEGAGGFLLGVGTFGPSHQSVTIGLGFGFGGGDFEETPVVLLGGELQVSNNVKLLTENYIIPQVDNGIAFSAGIRFFSDRLAADFGLITALDILNDADGFPFLPWIGFAYHFGR